MRKSGFDLIADAIDAGLVHLHEQRWTRRAAELKAEIERVEGGAKEHAEQALRDHYTDRFRPETSRMALLDEAAARCWGEPIENQNRPLSAPPAPGCKGLGNTLR